MTDERTLDMKAGRMRVPRTRGAVGGVLLVLGGLWAGLVPFLGPYGNLAYTPSPNSTWKWTAARGWLEVLPGAVALVAGLLLIVSTNRIAACFAGWLGVAAGGWLVVGPVLAEPLSLTLGTPDPNQTKGIRATEAITFFYGIGAAIVLVAALTLGRLSVHSVRDLQAAERRAAEEAEREAEEARFAEEHRLFVQQQAERGRAAEDAERDRRAAAERDRTYSDTGVHDRAPAVADAEPEPVTMVKSQREPYAAADDRGSEPPSADERFAAERARIVEERRQTDEQEQPVPEDAAADADSHEPAHAAPAESGQPQRGDYPPFYGNRS